MNWQEQAEALWGKYWQSVLARTSGYSSRTIRRWKAGERTPDPDVLYKLKVTYLLWSKANEHRRIKANRMD